MWLDLDNNFQGIGAFVRYCFVTNELYPRDKGGIGRLVHNIVHHMKNTLDAAQISIVLPFVPQPQRANLIEYFDGVAELIFCTSIAERNSSCDYLTPENGRGSDPLNNAVVEGLLVLDAIQKAEHAQEASFDIIEVPDHGGLGAILLRARETGQALKNSKILCRLHSSFSIIAAFEPFEHARGHWAATRLDLERETIEKADYCIAHLETIAQANQEHFKLDSAWRARVVIQFPPVVMPILPPTDNRPPRSSPTEFLFASRFQAFKRPELFVRAALVFIQNHPNSDARFRMMSYGFDPLYVDRIRLLIPQEHRARILIEPHLSDDERAKILSGGILVQPSAYESLCLLAYEFAAGGGTVLLAQDCTAFGNSDRWDDGENCIMFAPTPEALASAMERAENWYPSAVVETAPSVAYPTLPKLADPNVIATNPRKTLAIVIAASDAPFQLTMLDAVQVSAEGANVSVQAILSYSGVTTPDPRVSVIKAHETLASVLHRIVSESGADCIVLLDTTVQPRRGFWRQAVYAIKPGTLFSTNTIVNQNNLSQLECFSGDMLHVGLSKIEIAPNCIALHPTDLQALINQDDDRDLIQRLKARLCQSACKLLLGPEPELEVDCPSSVKHNRALAGFGALNLSDSNRIFYLGLGLEGGQNDAPLRHKPSDWSIFQIRDDENAANLTSIDIGLEPIVYQLTGSAIGCRFVLALTCSLKSEGKARATVSLHETLDDKAALRANSEGLRRRVIRTGQTYQMRWGPFAPHTEGLQIVVAGDLVATLSINDVSLLTRE